MKNSLAENIHVENRQDKFSGSNAHFHLNTRREIFDLTGNETPVNEKFYGEQIDASQKIRQLFVPATQNGTNSLENHSRFAEEMNVDENIFSQKDEEMNFINEKMDEENDSPLNEDCDSGVDLLLPSSDEDSQDDQFCSKNADG